MTNHSAHTWRPARWNWQSAMLAVAVVLLTVLVVLALVGLVGGL